MVELDATRGSQEASQVLATMKRRVVGQEEAVNILADIVETYKAGFSDRTRPVGNALFLGPTGTGKTHVVESLALALFGSKDACVKIDCGEFQHSHEIAKLIGSPPGYLGHRETHPALTQEKINQWHTEKMPLSIILFDEIEKASDSLWNLLLGILDKAKLTLGDNRVVDFSKALIIMTSNLGSEQMSKVVGGGLGFVPEQVIDSLLDEKLGKVAVDAAKRKFTPEFFNRLQHVSVFHTLNEEQLARVLEVELASLQVRLLMQSTTKVFFHVTPKAKKVFLTEGFDKKYNARHLKRVLEKYITLPLAKLVSSTQVMDRDEIVIGVKEDGRFTYTLIEENDKGKK